MAFIADKQSHSINRSQIAHHQQGIFFRFDVNDTIFYPAMGWDIKKPQYS
ncbi:hypothetical protein L2729_04305 [Shewanella gelidimarina]|nr:hypothetical protein [Shewanella gelidimarina]MCL1057215.1 hypothetical protein [Shewanella gelidimarina]